MKAKILQHLTVIFVLFFLFINANVNAQSAGPDQYICIGGSVTLTATGGNFYSWTPTNTLSNPLIANPVASPSVTTTYTVEIEISSTNLMVNPSFNLTNTGFTSGYTYRTSYYTGSTSSGLYPEGLYTVFYDPHYYSGTGIGYHPDFYGTDHTTGTGNFMIINGGTVSPFLNVYTQNISVIPNTLYNFSVWVSTLSAASQTLSTTCNLRFTINGSDIGPFIRGPLTLNTWIQYNTSWTCPSGVVTATLQITDYNTIAGGNDFGLDDFYFSSVTTATDEVVVYVSNIQTTIVPTNVQCGIPNSGAVDLTVTGGIEPYTFLWNNGKTTQNITGLSSGVFIVTVKDAINCTKIASTTVTVNPSPSVTISPTSAAFCSGGSAVLTALPSGGTPPYTYYWSNTSVTKSITVTSGGTYIVTVTDYGSCTATASATVTVWNNPTPNILPSPANVCAGIPLPVNGNPSGGSGTYTTHAWTGSGAAFLSATNVVSPTFTCGAAGTYTLTYTVTDNRGCIGSSTRTVTVWANPTANILPNPAQVCAGVPLAMNGNPSGGSGTYTTHAWTGSGAGFLSATNVVSPTFTCGTPGTYTLTYTVTDNNGCVGSSTRSVTVWANPTANILPNPAQVCAGVPLVMNGNPSGGSGTYTTHAWTGSGTTYLSATNIQSPTFTCGVAGTYTLTYTVTDNRGCIGSSTRTVTVWANPTANITPDPASVCPGVPLPMNGNPAGGSGTYTTHAWTGSGAAFLSATNVVSPTFTCSVTGTYTLIYTVTDNNTCVGSSTRTVTVFNNMTANITPNPSTVCASVSLSMNGNPSGGIPPYSHTWTGTGSSYLSSTTVQSPTFTCGVAGTYTLTYTVTDSKGCVGSSTRTVTVWANPTANILPNPAQVCAGVPLAMNGNPSGGSGAYITHLWTGTGASYLNSTTVQSPTFTCGVAGTYTLTYTVTDNNGCVGSSTRTVTVWANPTPDILPKPASICASITLQMNGNPSGGSGTYTTHAWAGTGAIYLSATNIQSPTFTCGVAGTYTLTYTVTDNRGCIGSSTRTVTVWANPFVSTTPNSASACAGISQPFLAVPSLGTPPYTLLWTGSGASYLNTTTSALVTFTCTIPGTYTLNCTVTDNNGCTGSSTSTMVIWSNPTANITPNPAQVCAGIPLPMNGNPSGGSGTYITHAWTGTGAAYLSATNVQTPTFTCGIAGTYTLTYTVTDNNGCFGSSTRTVTVWANPTPDILPKPATVCAGVGLQMNGNPSGGSGTYVTHSWTGTGASYLNTTTVQSPTFTCGVAGTYTLTYTVTDNNGCVGSSTRTVTVWANPTADILPKPASVCASITIQMNGNPSGGSGTYTTHAWTGTGVAFLSATNIQSPTFTCGIAGTYTLTYTVTDNRGCVGSSTRTVTVYANPTANITPNPAIVCAQSGLLMNGNPTGGIPPYTHLWTGSGASYLSSTTVVSPTFTCGIAGTYTLTYTVTDNKGCQGSSTRSVLVHALPVVNAGPDQFLCNEYNTWLTGNWPDASSVGNWTIVSGPVTSTIVISPPNSPVATVAGLVPSLQPYVFRYTITTTYPDQTVCINSDDIQVTNYHHPTNAYAGMDQVFCIPTSSATLNGNVPLYGTGLWTKNSGPPGSVIVTPTSPTTQVTGLVAGTYVFFWTISNGICDDSQDEVIITVNAPPTASAGSSATICGGDTYVLANSSVSTSTTSIMWGTSGTGYFNNPTILHPTYVPSESDIASGTVTLYIMAYSAYPCPPAMSSMVLTIQAPPYAYAGPDATICETSVYCLCSAVALNYETFFWSTTGSGTFNDPNIINPVYTPSASDIAAGKVKLILHVQGHPPCGWITDTAVLCISRIPVAYAGPDTTICETGTYTILASSALYCDSPHWVTSGTGTFDDPDILHPTYTPSQSDIASGCVTLSLYLLGCSPCPNDTDEMVLCFSHPPTVVASVIQHVSCYGLSDGKVTASVTGGRAPYSYTWNTVPVQTTQTATGLPAGTYWVTVTDYYSCTATASATVTQPELLTINSVVTHVSCYTYSNGAVNITVNGGTPGYTYSWSNGATTQNISGLPGSPSGITYCVTVTDAHGCVATDCAVVTAPEPWNTCISGPLIVCQGAIKYYCICEPREGSTFEWTVTGGTILSGCCGLCVTIQWDNCATGTICVTETQGPNGPQPGCVLTTCKTVTIRPLPVPVITGPAVVNAGQAGTVYCTPNNPGSLYNWAVIGGTVTAGQGLNCITVTWDAICNGCQGSVTVYETDSCCTGVATMNVTIIPGAGNLTGYVKYKNLYNTGLNGVHVALRTSGGTLIDNAVTGPNPSNSNLAGFYSFPSIPNGNYLLSASFDGPWGGNNATDALIIELYTASLYSLTGLNLAVGDVNADFNVNATDALWVKLRTIGMVNSYPAGNWKFTNASVTVSGTAAADLEGLCEGDVNASYIPTGLKETSFLAIIEDGVMTIPVNETFNYMIRSSKNADLGAMTLFLGYDENRFEVEKVSTTLEGMRYVIRDGEINLAWSNASPLSVNVNEPILTLQIKAREPVTIPSQIFDVRPGSEFADGGAYRFDNFDLKMANVVSPDGSMGFYIYNYPNPFQNTTDIEYRLPEQSRVKLVLTNMFGEVLRTLVDADQTAGLHKVKVDPADAKLMPGVYLYRIEVNGITSSFVRTSKMVFTR